MRVNLFGRRKTSSSSGTPNPSPSHHHQPSRRHRSSQGGSDLITTLTQLKQNVEDLNKRENFLYAKAEAVVREAVQKERSGDHRGALNCMKKKKLYEKEGKLTFFSS